MSSNERIRDDWDRLAPAWQAQQGYLLRSSWPIHQWLVRTVEPRPGQTILELAAGAGDTGFLIAAEVGKDGRVVSSDFSSRMVEVARQRGAELGLTNVDFRVLDAQNLGLADASFDGVVCRWGIMLMPDPAAALRECRRVLKPGGHLAFVVFRTAEENPWAGIPARVLSERGHLPPPTPGIPGILSLGNRDHLERLVEGAGFASYRIESVAMAWRFDDVDAYWKFLVDVTAFGPTLQGLSASDAEIVRNEIAVRAAAYREGDEVVLPGVCWCVAATRAA
jgi:ubiquinone/menaquinone biosynthesis C-methylase UbiE